MLLPAIFSYQINETARVSDSISIYPFSIFIDLFSFFGFILNILKLKNIMHLLR